MAKDKSGIVALITGQTPGCPDRLNLSLSHRLFTLRPVATQTLRRPANMRP
jgi:hypothetical protein